MQPELRLTQPEADHPQRATMPGHVPPIEEIGNELAAARMELDRQAKTVAALVKNMGDPGVCKGCGAEIWWMIHRNGKRAPYDPNGVNHFVTCVDREQFRKEKQHA